MYQILIRPKGETKYVEVLQTPNHADAQSAYMRRKSRGEDVRIAINYQGAKSNG